MEAVLGTGGKLAYGFSVEVEESVSAGEEEVASVVEVSAGAREVSDSTAEEVVSALEEVVSALEEVVSVEVTSSTTVAKSLNSVEYAAEILQYGEGTPTDEQTELAKLTATTTSLPTQLLM